MCIERSDLAVDLVRPPRAFETTMLSIRGVGGAAGIVRAEVSQKAVIGLLAAPPYVEAEVVPTLSRAGSPNVAAGAPGGCRQSALVVDGRLSRTRGGKTGRQR